MPPPLRGVRPSVGDMLAIDLLPSVARSLNCSDRRVLRELCIASRDAYDRSVTRSLRLLDAEDRSVAEVARTARAILDRGCCPTRMRVDLQQGDIKERQQAV